MAETITNEFTVNRPIEEAWSVLCDVERIAPCLPGAQLQEIEGDVFRGVVKIKLGAVNANFKGEASFVERDDAGHRAVLSASGRDTGGRGNASADVTAEAVALSPTSTRCTVTAELHITGKVAQFGRGIMGDVSKKLMDQFSANLNTMLDEQSIDQPSSEPAEEATPSTVEAAATDDTGGSDRPTVRQINGPAAEPIDVAGLAGPAVLKRAAPAVAVLLLLLILFRRRR
ncbi:SRPBCC family protein [Ilumatobacteraceae bacterium]|nr:SRPBCC family protein [Ilumatobacteraceae bacterium]